MVVYFVENSPWLDMGMCQDVGEETAGPLRWMGILSLHRQERLLKLM
jgi:hypothetical protein